MLSSGRFTENYHTHTLRCQHASGSVIDYVLAARNAGIKVLGLSDHTPLPDQRWGHVRMEMKELSGYLSEIRDAAAQVPEVKLLTAFECEYSPEYAVFYQEYLLPFCDYLISGAHWLPLGKHWAGMETLVPTDESLTAYADYLVASMESGLFLFQAHPDFFAAFCPVWNLATERCARTILACAQATGAILEINAFGIRKPWIETPEGRRPRYPWRPFWELAATYKVQVVINSDAHRPEDIVAKMDEALAIAEEFGLPLADMPSALKEYRTRL